MSSRRGREVESSESSGLSVTSSDSEEGPAKKEMKEESSGSDSDVSSALYAKTKKPRPRSALEEARDSIQRGGERYLKKFQRRRASSQTRDSTETPRAPPDPRRHSLSELDVERIHRSLLTAQNTGGAGHRSNSGTGKRSQHSVYASPPQIPPPPPPQLPHHNLNTPQESTTRAGKSNERGKIYRLDCLTWMEKAWRSGLWAGGQAAARIPPLIILASLLLAALCLIPLVIHKDSFQPLPSPLASFSPDNEDLIAVNEDSAYRDSQAPLFNASNPAFAPLERYSRSDFAVLLRFRRGGSVAREEILEALLELGERIRSLRVENYDYASLCRLTHRSVCATEGVRTLLSSGLGPHLTYPETYATGIPGAWKEDNVSRVNLAGTFGGVRTEGDGALARAQGLALHYRLRPNLPANILHKWDQGFQAILSNSSDLFSEDLELSSWSHDAYAEAVEEGLGKVWTHLGFSFLILLLGCVIGLFRLSPYRSKPLLGVAIAFIIVLAGLCGLSLRMGGTGSFNAATFPIFFVLAGIGILVLAGLVQSWSSFSNAAIHPREKVQFILGWDGPLLATLALTLIATFAILGGILGLDYYSELCFALAGSVGLFLLLTLGVFVPSLYLEGRREAAGLRWWEFWREGDTHFPLPLTKDYDERNLLRLHAKLLDQQPSPARSFGAALAKVELRYAALFCLALYAIFAIWGCSMGRVELSEESLVPAPSSPASFLSAFRPLFARTERHLQLIFHGSVDYMEPTTRVAILDMLDWAVEEKYALKSVSWLRDFLRFEQSSIYLVNRDTFVPVVNLIFLRTQPYTDYAEDIALDAYASQIVGSRMYLELSSEGEAAEREIISELLSRAEHAGLPLRVEAPGIFLLQHNMGLPKILLVGLLVPVLLLGLGTLVGTAQPLTALLVMGASSSIAMGTLGYGSLWGVPLNAPTAALVLVGLAHSAAAVLNLAHHFAGAGVRRMASARLEYAMQASLWPLLLSLLIPILAFLPLLSLQIPLLTQMGKVLLLHLAFTGIHALFFAPATLALVTLHMPHCCLALKESCEGCCGSEEDATSIYYIPTAAHSIHPETLHRFLGNRALAYVEEKAEGHYALPPPPRREMIMPPPPASLRRQGPPDLLSEEGGGRGTGTGLQPRIHSRASSVASARRARTPQPLGDTSHSYRRRHESRSPERGDLDEATAERRGRRGTGSGTGTGSGAGGRVGRERERERERQRTSREEPSPSEEPRGDSPASLAESGSVYVVQDGTGGRQDMRHVPRHFQRGDHRARAYASARWSREAEQAYPPMPSHLYAMDDLRWHGGGRMSQPQPQPPPPPPPPMPYHHHPQHPHHHFNHPPPPSLRSRQLRSQPHHPLPPW